MQLLIWIKLLRNYQNRKKSDIDIRVCKQQALYNSHISNVGYII
jgi:hypothetical protein